MDIIEILKLIWPIIVLQLAFQIYALIDLFKTKKGITRNLSSVIWAIIIVFGEIAGPALYFLIGRNDK